MVRIHFPPAVSLRTIGSYAAREPYRHTWNAGAVQRAAAAEGTKSPRLGGFIAVFAPDSWRRMRC